MHTLIVHTDTAAHANKLAALLKDIGYVKSVETRKSSAALAPADWVRPGRPLTDEELDQLSIEMRAEEAAGKYLTLKEAKAKTLKSLKQWKKENLK